MNGQRRTQTLIQRCLSDWLGVEEVPVVVRIWTPPAPCMPKRRKRRRKLKRGFRDLPLFQKRRRTREPTRARVLSPITPLVVPETPVVVPLFTPVPATDVPVKKPVRRSLHPKKVTRAERATWQKLPDHWDAERPRCRADCIGNRECPWCGKPVAMAISYRVTPAQITCPECHQRVSYQHKHDGCDWTWQKFVPSAQTLGDPDRLPMVARNRCRPCWMARCPSHLYLEVKEDCGAIKLNFPSIAPEDMDLMSDTCSLDVADREDDPDRVGKDPKLLPLEIVGRKLGLTLERARQLEEQALQEVHARSLRNNSGCA